jgi:alpha-D-ribose 1-methylphosphonate 5-triphosphate diphosphatase
VHLRLEVTNWQAFPLVVDLLREDGVGLLSFMHHAPGQGQYRDPQRYHAYLRKTFALSDAELAEVLRQKEEGARRVSPEDLAALARVARVRGVPLAGHDPDSPERVEEDLRRGASIVEFPVTVEAAAAAAGRVHISVGAPNVLHGGSHDGNLRARDLIARRYATVLCSDYYPAGLLPAVFKLVQEGVCTLPDAVALASLHPSEAVGLSGSRGALLPGYDADMILVSLIDGKPHLVATIVNGRVVLSVATPHPANDKGYGQHASLSSSPTVSRTFWPVHSYYNVT